MAPIGYFVRLYDVIVLRLLVAPLWDQLTYLKTIDSRVP
jgi:hypothetical protein